MNQAPNNRWLHRYAIFVAFATFLLIIAGALVTSNDAGLSVPDWPTSFGSFRMPRMVGGVKFEHGHRMIAAFVGLLTVFLAAWLWVREPRRWVRRLGGLAVLTVVAQAALGGLTVLLYLPVPISVGHACLAQIFFCIAVSLALFTRPGFRWEPAKIIEDPRSPSLRKLTAGTTAVIFSQLILGAAFRHNGFGILPHVIVAGLVTLGVLWVSARVLAEFRHERRLVRSAALLAGLLFIQIFLGIASYMMKLAARGAPQPLLGVVAVTTTHVAVGALVLAASLVVALEAYRVLGAPARAIQIARAPESAVGL